MEYLSYIVLALPFAFAILLALGLCVLFWGLYRKPEIALWLVAALMVAQTWVVEFPAINFGIFFYPADFVFAGIAVAALMRLFWGGQLQRIPASLTILSSVLALSLALGLAKFGRTAGVEFRGDFYFWVGTIYFLSFPATKELLSSFAKVWIVSAVAILVIACYRWLAVALGVDWLQPISEFADPLGNLYKYRVVNASQALVLGEALILLVYAMAMGAASRILRFLIPLLAIAVLVLQHRSVWLSTFVALMSAFTLLRNGREKLIGHLAAVAVITAMIFVPLLMEGGGKKLASSIAAQAEAAMNLSAGTSGDRIHGWEVLLARWERSGPLDYATGHPYGTGYERYSKHGTKIAYEPHNYYVQMLLNTGLIGLGCMLAIYWSGIRGLRRDQGGGGHQEVSGAALVALLICQLLYFIPYSPDYSQGVVLGIALSLVRGGIAGWRRPTMMEQKA